jgi:hypothetical protein
LPDHLPREEIVHHPGSVCPGCGGIVQAAMEWEDAHLWEFAVGRERIGSSRAAKLSLHSLLRPRTTKLT